MIKWLQPGIEHTQIECFGFGLDSGVDVDVGVGVGDFEGRERGVEGGSLVLRYPA